MAKSKKENKSRGRKKEYTTEKVIDSLNETAYKAEDFFERNAKPILSVFGVLALLAIGYFVYLKTYLEPRSEKALIEMTQADDYLKLDSTLLALKGSPGSFQGYEQIIDKYGNTKAGNLAKYKAGVAYFRLGDYASAVKSMEDFKTSDNILNAQRNCLIGDALVNSEKLEEAVPYYVKAGQLTDIQVLESMYYTKAGKTAFLLGKNEEALKYFNTILNKYPDQADVEVQKFAERLKYATENVDSQ